MPGLVARGMTASAGEVAMGGGGKGKKVAVKQKAVLMVKELVAAAMEGTGNRSLSAA